MTGWHKQRLCVWDLETTAPDPEEARIVTATVAMVGGGQPTEIASWVADPGVEIPEGAAAVHGYTTERVRAEGKPLADVLPEIVGMLTVAVAAGLPLIAYNAVYDNTVLDRETRRFGLDPFAAVLANARVIDPLCLDKKLDRYRKGSRTLSSTAEHYGVEMGEAHTSDADSLATARIAYVIGQRSQMTFEQLTRLYADRRFPDRIARDWQAFGRLTLDEVHAGQVGWYAEQSRSLGEYWARAAEEKRVQADRDDPPGDDGLGPDERRQVLLDEAAELEQRISTLRTEWPLAVFRG